MASPANVEGLQRFVPFDGITPNHLRLIAPQIEYQELPANRVLFKRGQPGDLAFFLLQGSVDLADASFQIRHFNADDDENYLALDDFDVHSVSAITTEKSLVCSLPRALLKLVNDWVQLGDSSDGDGTPEDSDEGWMEALLESGLFAQIPPTKIQSLFARFESCEVKMGDVVIKEGEEGDTFYVLKQGYALVTKQQGKGQRTLAGIRSGQFFGEDALISDRPRGASIVMISDGELMRLGKQDFRALLQDSVVRHLSEEAMEKLEEEMDRPVVLLDIRSEMDARHDHIPGARNIPLASLRSAQGQLEKSFIYAVCGDNPRNAELGAYLMSDAGFEAYVLDRKVAKEEDKTQGNNPGDGKQDATKTDTQQG